METKMDKEITGSIIVGFAIFSCLCGLLVSLAK